MLVPEQEEDLPRKLLGLACGRWPGRSHYAGSCAAAGIQDYILVAGIQGWLAVDSYLMVCTLGLVVDRQNQGAGSHNQVVGNLCLVGGTQYWVVDTLCQVGGNQYQVVYTLCQVGGTQYWVFDTLCWVGGTLCWVGGTQSGTLPVVGIEGEGTYSHQIILEGT